MLLGEHKVQFYHYSNYNVIRTANNIGGLSLAVYNIVTIVAHQRLIQGLNKVYGSELFGVFWGMLIEFKRVVRINISILIG